MSTSNIAVELVLQYERDRGFTPLDVSRNRTFIGYDVISRGPDDKVRLIEVKGTSKEWGARACNSYTLVCGQTATVKIFMSSYHPPHMLSAGTTINVKLHSAGGMDYIKLVELV